MKMMLEKMLIALHNFASYIITEIPEYYPAMTLGLDSNSIPFAFLQILSVSSYISMTHPGLVPHTFKSNPFYYNYYL